MNSDSEPGVCRAPVLLLHLLVQLKLVVDRVHPASKLLVLPGIGSGDAVGPHGEERDGPWGGFSHREGVELCTGGEMSWRSGTFRSLWGVIFLRGHAWLLIERLWRVWRIFDHL